MDEIRINERYEAKQGALNRSGGVGSGRLAFLGGVMKERES